MSETILQEASRITAGARQSDYGHPVDDFGRTAALWSAVLGVPVGPQQVGLCMILVKVSRQCNKPGRDNLVDIAGYARTLEMVEEELEQRDEIAAAQKAIDESGANR